MVSRAVSILMPLIVFSGATGAARDARRFEEGRLIPDEGYCDQPYIVVTRDGSWLCTLTTGRGREGDRGQHVVATISADRGETWSALIDIEPADGPEASWAVPLIVPGGRVYVFYDYNGDSVDRLPGRSETIRADMLGWYCYRYSDDGGRTWSAQRYRLPVRVTACDRANQWGGDVQVLWGIDKPKVMSPMLVSTRPEDLGEFVVFAFTKLGRHLLDDGEGWLFRSRNILTEADPGKIVWEMLPGGEHGIRAEEYGSVQEEHNLLPLGGGRLYCVYRTGLGFPCHSYSEDGGRTWARPEPMTYVPGGRRMRNPRACPKLWRTAGGKYLFWFHDNGNKGFNQGPGYGSRNIAWLSAGKQKAGRLCWSQPEIVRYATNPLHGCSYPDLVEQDGRFWISATQKTEARIAEVDPALLDGLWRQDEVRSAAAEGLVLRPSAEELSSGKVAMPRLPDLSTGGGFTVDLWFRLEGFAPGQVLLDSTTRAGAGISVRTEEGATLQLELGDGRESARWACDPGLLRPGEIHHVVFIVDGGPKVISVVVDGVLCDGSSGGGSAGGERPYGYGRFLRAAHVNRGSDRRQDAHEIGDVTGGPMLSISGAVRSLRVYDRFLRTSEAVGNFRAGSR